jgi:hypothetical protein
MAKTAAEKSTFERVMKNLNKEVEKIQGKTLKGLIRSAVIIRRAMDTEAPKIPVDTGNLRQSWFVTTSKGQVQRGGNASFEGKDAAKMTAQHSSTTANMAALARAKGGKNKPLIILGFSANYAAFVHENVGATSVPKYLSGKDVTRRPGSGPKFFESAINNHEKEILDMIKHEAKIK